jgi:hypothetical protein
VAKSAGFCISAALPSRFGSPTIPARDIREIHFSILLGDWGMSSFRNFAFGATLGVALSWSLLPTAGQAYTQEEQQACQPDAFRLCSSEIPDVDRVTACMVARKSQLSPECRRFFRDGPQPDEAVAAPAGRPMSIKPAATHKTKTTTKTTSKTKAKPKKTAKPDAA